MRPIRPRTLAIFLLAAVGVGGMAPSASSHGVRRVSSAGGDPIPAARFDASAYGRSGTLRVAVVDPGESLRFPVAWTGEIPEAPTYRWAGIDGTPAGGPIEPFAGELRAPARSGAWRLRLGGGGWSQELIDLAVVTRIPFHEKRGGYVNRYFIGRWETEGSGRSDRYAPPPGFIEVTRENQDLRVSEHFRLRDFLTKNQFDVWPKYIVLDLRLIDKLELVMQELNAMGIRADHMAVMSGFRTPAYNGPGGDGRARLSRHTYGDASDVWIDNDHDGYMDDLNQDGRRDTGDAEVILRAVDRVEFRYPELVGGAGVYLENGARGPFVHIDVRGSRSRW